MDCLPSFSSDAARECWRLGFDLHLAHTKDIVRPEMAENAVVLRSFYAPFLKGWDMQTRGE